MYRRSGCCVPFGWRLARAAIAVALLLGTIETIQIHLRGRAAEITDTLLALVLASCLGLIESPIESAEITEIPAVRCKSPFLNKLFACKKRILMLSRTDSSMSLFYP